MNLYLDYISPDYILSETADSSGGSITAGQTADYFYDPTDLKILREGVIRVDLSIVVSGSLGIKPTLYLGDPTEGFVLFEGNSRTFTSESALPVWEGETFVPHPLDEGLTLRLEVTEDSDTPPSAVTFGNSLVAADIREGSSEFVEGYTEDEFTLLLVREYMFGFTQTDVKEFVEIPVFSETTSSEIIEVSAYTETKISENLEIRGFTETDVHVPVFENYISNLRMGRGERDLILSDGLSIVRSGKWLADSYNQNHPEVIPPSNAEAPETWSMKMRVADSMVRATNAAFVDQGNPHLKDLPGNQLDVYFPDNTYTGTYVYRHGEWQLPHNYEGEYTVHFPLYLDGQNHVPTALWFMIRHAEDDSYLAATTDSLYSQHILKQRVSSTEIAEVFYWDSVKIPITVVLRIKNFEGTAPGFRGTSASIFYAR